MNVRLFQLALFEIVLSLILGVAILYLTYRLIHRMMERRAIEETENVAFAVFAASILISVGVIVSGVIQPALSTLRILTAAETGLGTTLLTFTRYLVQFFAVASVLAFVVDLCGIRLFLWCTHVDEFEEIRRGNVAVAIVTGATILIMTLFVREGVVFLLESMVPYPDAPPF